MKAATRISIAERVKELREEMGMNPKIIAEMTGHSIPADLLEATTFQVYSHVQVSMQREAISFIENKLLN